MRKFKKPLLLLLIIVILMGLSHKFFLQFDMTNDKRYSLSKETLSKIKSLKGPLRIDVLFTLSK